MNLQAGTPQLSEKLSEAWALKQGQRIEETLALSAEIKQALAGQRNPDPALQAESHLLSGSLARTQGQYSAARELIRKAQELLVAVDRGNDPRLLFERGFVHYSFGDFALALDDFLAAAAACRPIAGTKARRPLSRERALGLLNAVLCMENLAIPFEHTLGELRALLERSPEAARGTAIEAQLRALELRRRFREGRILALYQDGDGKPSRDLDQCAYYRLWVSQLPYHSKSRPLASGDIETFLLGARYFQHKSYRLRTLQGLLHPEDLRIAKPSESVDRLYLWVWRWLSDPEKFTLPRIMALLEGIRVRDILHRLTAEDLEMLRNSVSWLALFDPASARAAEELLELLQGSAAPNARAQDPVFELESLVSQYARTLQTGQELLAGDLATSIRLHPLYRSKEIGFGALFDFIATGKSEAIARFALLAPVAERVRSLVQREEMEGDARFIVDLPKGEIRDRRDGSVQVSPGMAATLRLLSRCSTVSCEELAAAAFGITRYDSLTHQGKIFNLLARMRKVFTGVLDFRVKSGFVLADGQWNQVALVGADAQSESLRARSEWKGFLARRDGSADPETKVLRALQRVADTQIKPVMSRREIEAVLGKSRATANRIIALWVRKGWIEVEGAARATRYRVNERLRRELSKSNGVSS